MPVGVGAKPAGGTAARPVPAAAKPAAPPTAPPAGANPGGGGGLKKILVIVLIVVILAVLAVGVFLALKLLGVFGGGGDEDTPKPAKTTKALVMGELSVSTGEPLSINLDDGYMSFAATIYFDEDVKAEGEGSSEIDPSPARDAALRIFKGMKKEDFDKSGAIEEMKKKYTAELNKSPIPPYHGHVVTVQFTTFAYQ
ncbi:flagellar basal body-associated FliL family protein [Mobiluncus curtisii]|uniref:flagellar basal body-associated FliL family protein n=1 Tax=Mobiluncus curtisii TaxID=2051 RepID=UPI0014705776|nr:flagellar basal body-associated FliL family protein [Mobiluncus curtisii]NMW47680.1 flagellar basal body-associated FliL family protein [Mobiluncus curtisii]